MYQRKQRKYGSNRNHEMVTQEKTNAQVNMPALIQRAAQEPANVSPSEWMQLQSSVGHQATRQVLTDTMQRMEDPIQKMDVEDEEEMQMKRNDDPVQRFESEEEDEIQMKRDDESLQRMVGEDDEELQMKKK